MICVRVRPEPGPTTISCSCLLFRKVQNNNCRCSCNQTHSFTCRLTRLLQRWDEWTRLTRMYSRWNWNLLCYIASCCCISLVFFSVLNNQLRIVLSQVRVKQSELSATFTYQNQRLALQLCTNQIFKSISQAHSFVSVSLRAGWAGFVFRGKHLLQKCWIKYKIL